jgi:hypothetical protein
MVWHLRKSEVKKIFGIKRNVRLEDGDFHARVKFMWQLLKDKGLDPCDCDNLASIDWRTEFENRNL